MSKINILESRVFNRIAAGEVVERPASIVKELVENSIDSGAKNIVIEIIDGGIKKIQVSDNGSGIEFDDLKKAFLPHATSKIKNEDDLDAIQTLGFRGEALASIGSVAEVSLVSKTKDSEFGGKIEVTGGVIQTPSECGAADGTYITVSNIFYNIPARAKFLKKPKTEESQITDIISRFILANPYISFKYVADGKQIYYSTGKGKEDSIFAVYGKEGLQNLIPLNFDFGAIRISGFTGKPTFSKPNKNYETLIVNGRYVINSTVAQAAYNAYSSYLMKHQFPVFVLYLDIDYSSVDVNVHPNKLDVRFENSGLIYSKVFESITRTISDIRIIPSVEEGDISTKLENTTRSLLNQIAEKPKIEHNDETKIEYKNKLFIEPESKQITLEKSSDILSAINVLKDGTSVSDSVGFSSNLFDSLYEKYEKKDEEEKDARDELNIDPIIIGKVFNTFLLVEYDNSLILIDQHAAHERLLYDKFKHEVENGIPASQDLLVPYVIRLSAVESRFFETKIEFLNDIGFNIEPFGINTFRVYSVPFLCADINIKEFFDLMISDEKNIKELTRSDIIKDTLAKHACKAAVKGGDDLRLPEIEKLLTNISKEKIVLLCPHGRPVAIRITKSEIEKWFKRIV